MQLSLVCSADLVTQAFGCTAEALEWSRPDCPGGHFHAGLDLGWSDGGNNHLGEPVRALVPGVVVGIGPVYPANGAQYLGPFAPCIRDAHGRIWEYGHVQAVHVGLGEVVAAEQWIADVGSLGASTAGHVHLELRTDGPIQGPPWWAVLDPTLEALGGLDFDMYLLSSKQGNGVYLLTGSACIYLGDPTDVQTLKDAGIKSVDVDDVTIAELQAGFAAGHLASSLKVSGTFTVSS